MISITSDKFWAAIGAAIAFGIVAVCLISTSIVVSRMALPPPEVKNQRSRVPTMPAEANKPEPAPVPPPEKPDKEEEAFFGSTYWDELLTSVYWYPESKMTHLNFNHRDDDIWLCDDQRRNFDPGKRYKLSVTFEPNQPCATNWKTFP
jgi:hypothetical protein